METRTIVLDYKSDYRNYMSWLKNTKTNQFYALKHSGKNPDSFVIMDNGINELLVVYSTGPVISGNIIIPKEPGTYTYNVSYVDTGNESKN